MKVVILSRAPHAYSTRRLREACLVGGYTVRVLDTLRFSISVEEDDPQLYYRDKRLSRYDAVIPRVGTSVTLYGTAVVRQFEQMGVFTLASSHAIRVSRDKLRSLQVLSRHHIGIPQTVFVQDRGSVAPAIERLGGAPVVIKVLEGTQGGGVILAESVKMAQSIIETLHGARQHVLIQRFVEESRGRDVRAFVVGGQVVAAMRRVAQGAEFRSNVHLGGRTEPIRLEPEYERSAIEAAQIMGLRVAGVDMLESDDGPLVMEVNSSPGLQGIEAATGIDVAGAIVAHMGEELLLPEVDVKQRLTLAKGYGVAEFELTTDGPLTGRTIADLALDERDIRILSIQRDSLIIPNPRDHQELLSGDQIVAYGNVSALKALIPQDELGRRRPARRPKRRSKGPTA
ncbi:MAG: RimK family alpha-L-glutamate ligase [Sandaracinaceae bacterium]|nr:RimK family alpha-L-glutamate ligase [Sandaracinaceae bacterium]